MRKRKTIFLETLVLSLTVVLISTTMAHCTYPSLFEGSLSEKICLDQGRENPELSGGASQFLALSGIALKFGPIPNTIGVNAKISCFPTWIFRGHPRSITAQILPQSLARASPS